MTKLKKIGLFAILSVVVASVTIVKTVYKISKDINKSLDYNLFI